jgi:hypothetical protein
MRTMSKCKECGRERPMTGVHRLADLMEFDFDAVLAGRCAECACEEWLDAREAAQARNNE